MDESYEQARVRPGSPRIQLQFADMRFVAFRVQV